MSSTTFTTTITTSSVYETLSTIAGQFSSQQEALGLAKTETLPKSVQEKLNTFFQFNCCSLDVQARSFATHAPEQLDQKKAAVCDLMKIMTANTTYPLALSAGFPKPHSGLDCSLASIANDFLQQDSTAAIEKIEALPQEIRNAIHGHFYECCHRPEEEEFGKKIEDQYYSDPIFKAKVIIDFSRKFALPDTRALKAEYEALESASATLTEDRTKSVGSSETNSSKNSSSVVPFDKSLVSLTNDTYVNASRVLDDGYIITQSPLEYPSTDEESTLNTAASFWQLIVESNAQVVVMLNGTSDELFFPYFPKENSDITNFDGYEIRCISQETIELDTLPDKSSITERTLLLTSSDTSRIIHHIKCNHWHDFGVGQYDPLMEMIRRVDKHSTGEFPIVVHCKAGVGRSSIFAGIHKNFALAKNGAEYSFHETVKSLRNSETGRHSDMIERESGYLSSIRFLRCQEPTFKNKSS